jgi:hypothetical protein
MHACYSVGSVPTALPARMCRSNAGCLYSILCSLNVGVVLKCECGEFTTLHLFELTVHKSRCIHHPAADLEEDELCARYEDDVTRSNMGPKTGTLIRFLGFVLLQLWIFACLECHCSKGTPRIPVPESLVLESRSHHAVLSCYTTVVRLCCLDNWCR